MLHRQFAKYRFMDLCVGVVVVVAAAAVVVLFLFLFFLNLLLKSHLTTFLIFPSVERACEKGTLIKTLPLPWPEKNHIPYSSLSISTRNSSRKI